MRVISLVASGVAVLLAGGCAEQVDYFSNVHDVRVLAIQAEPPEVLLDPANPAPPTFALKALVADKDGATGGASFSFATCEVPDGDRCRRNTPERPLSGGAVEGVLATGLFSPGAELVEAAIREDAYEGLGGLPLPVLLHAASGSARVDAFKRVVLSRVEPFAPLVRANANPPAPKVAIDGVAADSGPAQIPRSGAAFETVAPQAEQVETYYVPTFDRSQRQLTESWEYSWFTTRGHFSPEHTSWSAGATDRTTSTRLVLESEDGEGPFRVWVVVRDGRGGVGWTEIACVR